MSNIDLVETLVDKLELLLSITEQFKNQLEGDDLAQFQDISAMVADLREEG